MTKLRCLCVLVLVLMVALPASAEPGDVENNPYVVLYKRRVELSQIAVERQTAQVDFELAQQARFRRLLAANALAREEFDKQVAATGVAQATLKDLKVRVREQEAILEIARMRITAGQDMPICTPYDDNR